MITDPALATAADYADALIVARRAKNLMLLIILLMLLAQLAMFFVARYTNAISPGNLTSAEPAVSLAITTPTTSVSTTALTTRWPDVAQYLTGLFIFLTLLLTITMSMVLYLIVKIMLVGRLIGVARLTGAFILSIFLLVLLFPWQSFLASATFSDPSFKPPGVLYMWSELMADGGAKFHTEVLSVAILKWARFVAFPVAAILVLLIIQVKSNRGLRQALGEESSLENFTPVGTEPLV